MILNLNQLFIKNRKFPVCVDCKYYKPPGHTYKNSIMSYSNGKCQVFGEKNLETGETMYTDALTCRSNEKQCGTLAVYFEEKEKSR
jgi:hypothetical protein